MEEIQCVPEEAQEEPDPKLKTIQCPAAAVEEEEEEEDDDDSDQDFRSSNDPFVGRWDPPPVLVCTAGAGYTKEEAEEIFESVYDRDDELLLKWCEMVEGNVKPLPPVPQRVLPKITTCCVSGVGCYHLRYWTEITSETKPDHPYFIPCEMMQVFSLGLSRPLTYPVNIYGWVSVRDGWQPLRNYVFKCSRDDPAMISPGCSFLPLRSPCRGIYVMQYCLIDIGLWIKEEGDGSDDKLLFSGYGEINTSLTGFGLILRRRFQGDCLGLDMHFAFLGDGIETLIEVKAEAKQPSDLRISASTSGFNEEISLYDGKFCGSGTMFKHFMAVNKQDELHIVLKMDEARYKWTSKAGVGVVVAPEHPVSGFAQYFVMNVSFRTRGKEASAWQWSCIGNVVNVSAIDP
ncbi:hypothetical protein U9M48_014790 [Paspalum notatum var. saurae]|uniref:DUF6598 domain-containing protein n=1 Tax=Paspalum notatum var. saurae TaxID=547442 RepID=A0AAQ3WL93_PASNO